MYDFIPSEFVRNYYKEKGIEFSDRERATMIWDQPFSYEEAYERLGKIAAETSDKELSSEIERLLAHLDELLERMKANEDHKYIYTLSMTNAYFYSYDEAYQFGIKKFRGERFKILKFPVGNCTQDCDLVIPKEGIAGFNGDGKLFFLSDGPSFMKNIGFANAFVPLKNPFKRGDIVMDCFSRKIGVVESVKTDCPYFGCVRSSVASVAFVGWSGNLCNQLISLIHLEKVGEFNNKGPGADLIRDASKVLRGGKDLSDFLSSYDSLKEKIKNRIYTDDPQVFAEKKGEQND